MHPNVKVQGVTCTVRIIHDTSGNLSNFVEIQVINNHFQYKYIHKESMKWNIYPHMGSQTGTEEFTKSSHMRLVCDTANSHMYLIDFRIHLGFLDFFTRDAYVSYIRTEFFRLKNLFLVALEQLGDSLEEIRGSHGGNMLGPTYGASTPSEDQEEWTYVEGQSTTPSQPQPTSQVARGSNVTSQAMRQEPERPVRMEDAIWFKDEGVKECFDNKCTFNVEKKIILRGLEDSFPMVLE
ncbi:hypothetical protein RND71_031891 [Anisodus tanguticus]|uniref:Ycf2 N-terminal domain-containing protein n=1 Tax=Anisodus tanguticus TaxID=243964 RepID=A0AAE1V3N5_9SOLA|nr:hypothetical protein RND71_031891 [Anisodus tanguticus]